MKKIFLCFVLTVLSVSAASGGAVQDFMDEAENAMNFATSPEQVSAQVGVLFTIERVKALIDSGDDINTKNGMGVNVLMLASAFSNSPEIIKLLLEAGSDINATDENGATALMIAAVNADCPDIIKILAGAGIDVNAKSKEGHTALMLAAVYNKNPEVVRALINAGSDVKATDSFFFGKTAKDLAVQNGASQEIIKILEGENE